MRIKMLSAIVLGFFVVASCSTRVAKTTPANPTATAANANFTVIGTMQSRDKIVTVKTGSAGIVYSIATKDGQRLYENISAEKLKAEAPALHDFIESGTAGYAGLYMEKPLIDARLDARR
jgi:hypothetical protein